MTDELAKLDATHAPLLLQTSGLLSNSTPNPIIDDDQQDTIWLYFLSLMIIILVHRAVGTVFHKLGTPRIIGDIVAGCMLGPTIMGSDANSWLFPRENRAILNMFGQFGLIMTSMSAGFSFDRRVMQGRSMKITVYTVLNMAIPALVSIPLYFALPNNTNWRGVAFSAAPYFVLVVCAMSSSALPMVFLILDEMRVNNDTSRFAIGLSCLSTIGLFTLLSVVAVLSDDTLSTSLIAVRLIFLALIFIFLFLLQYLWGWLLRRSHATNKLGFLRYGSDDMAILVISLGLISAICSERLGYTFLLGAFLAGAAMPFDIGLRSNLGEKVRWLTRWVFLPQFFVAAGLKFDLRKLKGQSVPYVILFLILAFLAKALLVPISHYLLKIRWRDSAFCAALANCRGFNALIVAQFGSQYGLIGDSFFITCVLLSIFSTTATGPLAKYFRPDDEPHGVAAGAGVSARSPLRHRTPPVASGGSMGQSIKEPLSPSRLRDGSSSDGDEARLDDISLDSTGAPTSVRIVLPHTSDGSSATEASSASVASSSGVSGIPHTSPEDREAFFSSWLSENFDAKTRSVLVIIAEDLKARLRDPSSSLARDDASGEIRFRGDSFVDFLCQLYSLETRSVGVTAGQKLLEAGVIVPVDSAIFLDKPQCQYSIG